jgi:hypothetical protein
MANQFKESEFGGGYGSTGVDVDANGDISMDGNLIVGGTLTAGGANAIVGTVGATTNRLVRSDGTGTKTVKATGITVGDSNNVSGVGTLAIGGALTGVTTMAMTGNNITSTASEFNLIASIAGQALLKLSPNPSDGTSNAVIQIMRNTNTTGTRTSTWFKGDGTTDSALQLNHGTATVTMYGPLTGVTNFTSSGTVTVTGISASGGTSSTAALADRTYTPTTAASTNCDSVTWGLWRWIRVGQRVTAFGSVSIDPTAASTVTVNFNAPVASAFTNSNQASGHGNSVTGTPTTQPTMIADATNDNIQLIFIPAATTSQSFFCSLMYDVV